MKKTKEDLPTVSIIIPTYNEEKNIKTCLNAILKQDYPSKLIEIIIVDNRSTDKTVDIVNQYKRKYPHISLIFNDIEKDAETSKMIGLHKSKGELFLYLDADIEIVGADWFSKLIRPLTTDSSFTGSFPRFIPKPDDVAIGRYLRYHPLELDPVFQFFCTEIKDTVIEKKDNYEICEFHPQKIPPIGVCIYRKEVLMKTIGKMKKFMDIDVPVILSKNGYNRFVYVQSCGIYHINIKTLSEIIKRRQRNIDQIYLPNIETREFTYFNLKNKSDILKIALWVIYANLFLPKLAEGLYKTIKNKDIACMYEPIVSILLTETIVLGFLKNKNGRNLFLGKMQNKLLVLR